jgi:hypothetical protein
LRQAGNTTFRLLDVDVSQALHPGHGNLENAAVGGGLQPKPAVVSFKVPLATSTSAAAQLGRESNGSFF